MPTNIDLNVDVHSVAQYYLSALAGIVEINSLGPESSFSVQSQSVYLGAFVPELAETGSLASLGLIQSGTGGLVNIEASGASPSVSLVVNLLENPDCISNLILNAEGFMVNYGLPGVGGFISINSSNVAIFMGDPSAGSSFVMTPDSITLKVGQATMTLTAEVLVTNAPAVNTVCDPTSVLINAEGITEVVGETVREMNEEGHTLTAAETEMNVGVEGLEAEVPTHTLEADGSLETNTALFSLSADGMQTMEAPISMQE